MHGDNLDITPLDEQTARTHMAALFGLRPVKACMRAFQTISAMRYQKMGSAF